MTSPPPSRGPDLARLLAIGAAVTLMVIVLLTLAPVLPKEPPPVHPPATPMALPREPIRAEALVFRTRPGDLAVAPDARARPAAQARTLAIYRGLRAYPGAPPRVPHGLTDQEFRLNLCNSCHRLGGFVQRFAAYAPVTPHPEYSECLQCHVADAMTVGIALPDGTPALPCSQCHVDPDRPPPSLVSLEWVPRRWPERNQRAMDGSPPVIPHDLQLRENCLACHAGPGAIREIRTTHPERVNCRQCHVVAEREELFARPPDGVVRGGSGGGP